MIEVTEHRTVDINILVYAADETSPFHQATVALREKGIKGEILLCICPQVLNDILCPVYFNKL